MSNARNATIRMEFQGYWLAGTGGGRGRHLDAACYRDADGLPAMPMSQIKGRLRETAVALARAGDLDWTPARVVDLLGWRADEELSESVTDAPVQAALAFDEDARIADNLRPWCVANRETLFKRLAATKVGETETAEDRTLRAIEVAVPLSLEGQVRWQQSGEPTVGNWIDLLDRLCAATISFGKNKLDGLGLALAAASPVPTVATALTSGNATTSAVGVITGRRLRLRLTQTRRAIFSAKSSTEGAHKTVEAPTGAALLGWCAAEAVYSHFVDPFAVFHGGKVRFGDARPLASTGKASFPAPKTLIAPKEEKSAAIVDDHVNGKVARLDRPGADELALQQVQFEPLKIGLMTEDWQVVKPRLDQRLRTATTEGRATEGQLFGYQHLTAFGEPQFEAGIEADMDVDESDWKRIIAAFDGKVLWLGRAKGTGYGGGFRCEVLAPGEPTGQMLPVGYQGLIRIQAMSDLALVDDWGSPTCWPTGEMFGLKLGETRFLADKSVLGLRRWAPQNGHLKRRDTERQVIEAGSVMVFEILQPLSSALATQQVAGLWREAGLGRIVINPDWLVTPPPARNATPVPDTEKAAASATAESGRTAERTANLPDALPGNLAARDEKLLGWILHQAVRSAASVEAQS